MERGSNYLMKGDGGNAIGEPLVMNGSLSVLRGRPSSLYNSFGSHRWYKFFEAGVLKDQKVTREALCVRVRSLETQARSANSSSGGYARSTVTQSPHSST